LDKLLKVEIVSPVKNVYTGYVKTVTAPGVLGEFQILYNHAALVSTLDIGALKLVDDKSNEIKYSISGGTLEVRDNNVIILAETIEGKEDIDLERAKKSLERANRRIASLESDFNRERALLSIKRAKNRLKITGD
jgi:F-type H+-transporting ATPase subunit epsilon